MKNTYDGNEIIIIHIGSLELGAVLGFCVKSDFSHDTLQEISNQASWQMAEQGILSISEDGSHKVIEHKLMEFHAPIWALDDITDIIVGAKSLFPEAAAEVGSLWASSVAQRDAYLAGKQSANID